MVLNTTLENITLGNFDTIGSTKNLSFFPTDDSEICNCYNLDQTKEYYINLLSKKDERINEFDEEKLWYLISKAINENANEYISYRISDMVTYYLPQECEVTAYFRYKNFVIDFLGDSVYKLKGFKLDKKVSSNIAEFFKTLNIKEDDLSDVIIFYNNTLVKESISNNVRELRRTSKSDLEEMVTNEVSTYINADRIDEMIDYFLEEIQQDEMDEYLLEHFTYEKIVEEIGGDKTDIKIKIN